MIKGERKNGISRKMTNRYEKVQNLNKGEPLTMTYMKQDNALLSGQLREKDDINGKSSDLN